MTIRAQKAEDFFFFGSIGDKLQAIWFLQNAHSMAELWHTWAVNWLNCLCVFFLIRDSIWNWKEERHEWQKKTMNDKKIPFDE